MLFCYVDWQMPYYGFAYKRLRNQTLLSIRVEVYDKKGRILKKYGQREFTLTLV